MKTSKVYFTNLRAKNGDNLLTKLQRLIKTAGIADIDFEDKYVAIKMHFGEPGNLAFLRPNYAKAVADVVRIRRQAFPDRLQYFICRRKKKCPGSSGQCKPERL